MTIFVKSLGMAAALLLLAACERPEPSQPPTPDPGRPPVPETNQPLPPPETVGEEAGLLTVSAHPGTHVAVRASGERLFQQHCAACHGERAQGSANWQRPGADGKYRPPPLNGTGHAWHHPKAQLMHTIRHGTQQSGGGMPAWGDKLSDRDIEAIIEWMQSLWPQELYQAWLEMDRQASQRH